MTIKHLVMSGGGPTMFQTLGALYYLETNDYLRLQDIETIYGTSAGAIISVCIALKFDWETINDYFIKRPWQDVFPIKAQNILDSYSKKGLFDIKTIEKCFKPLLDAKDLSLEITLEEFYNFSKIEIHFFTFEINEFKLEDISYLNYPKLSLLLAIQMTCGLPVLVTPVCLEGKCYVDGGIVCNYSLKYCVESGKKEDEILGLKNKYDKDNSLIDDKSNMMDFIMSFLFKTISSLNLDHIQPNIKNEVVFNTSFLTIELLKNALANIEFRKELFKSGEETAKIFLEKNIL